LINTLVIFSQLGLVYIVLVVVYNVMVMFLLEDRSSEPSTHVERECVCVCENRINHTMYLQHG